MTKGNPFMPQKSLLVKLGSLIIHYEEALSPKGHDADLVAIRTLREDAEVIAWLEQMDRLAMLPIKR